jgi:hypothetical protein
VKFQEYHQSNLAESRISFSFVHLPKFLVGSRLPEGILWLFKISMKGHVLWHMNV